MAWHVQCQPVWSGTAESGADQICLIKGSVGWAWAGIGRTGGCYKWDFFESAKITIICFSRVRSCHKQNERKIELKWSWTILKCLSTFFAYHDMFFCCCKQCKDGFHLFGKFSSVFESDFQSCWQPIFAFSKASQRKRTLSLFISYSLVSIIWHCDIFEISLA